MENIIIKKIFLRTPQDVKMFCLNLSEPVTLKVNIPDTETDFDEKAFLESLNEWSV